MLSARHSIGSVLGLVAQIGAAVAIGLVGSGCNGREPEPYPNWTKSGPVEGPDSLALDSLALQCEAAAASYLPYVDIKGDLAKKLDTGLAAPRAALLRKVASGATFGCRPRPLFGGSPVDLGCGLVGKNEAWRISDELSHNKFDDAINDFLDGSRLGQSLQRSDCADAMEGDGIQDECRAALAPGLLQMGASQLERLSRELSSLLARRPTRATVVASENFTLFGYIQDLQNDVLQKKIVADVIPNMGAAFMAGQSGLTQLEGSSYRDIVAFFSSLGKEATDEVTWLGASIGKPKSKRTDPPAHKGSRKAPWSDVAAFFFTTGRSWLATDDRTLARQRLLVMEAQLLAWIKAGRPLPTNLAGFAGDIMTDPYSGGRFLYVPRTGNEFLLYSVGENGVDDGGETDSTGESPDLFLEGAGH